MLSQQILIFRIAIAGLIVAALMGQIVVFPRVAADYASRYPEVAHLETPYLTAVVLGLVVLQVAAFAGWFMLSAMRETGHHGNWVPACANVMTGSLVTMAAIFAGIFIHASVVENVGGPPMLFGVLAAVALVFGAFAARQKVLSGTSSDRCATTVQKVSA